VVEKGAKGPGKKNEKWKATIKAKKWKDVTQWRSGGKGTGKYPKQGQVK